MKARYEPFGGIISVDEPPALAFVDKEYMKSVGYKDSPLWEKKKDYLSAPTEVHFSITNRCGMHCPGCYVDSGTEAEDELSFPQLKEVIDVLAEKGVFHIAFGGGEPTLHPQLIELAEYCREKGIVPNITTNGVAITEELAKRFSVFGQIHVSLDGLEEYYEKEGSNKKFADIDRGIRLLRKHNEHVGLNVVMNKDNFEIIPEIAKYAEKLHLEGILLLRYKPAGRAKKDYLEKRLTEKQHIEFYELLLRLHKGYRINVCVDCSCVPLFSSHHIFKKALEFFSVNGCDAGNILIGVDPHGRMNACSFSSEDAGSIFMFDENWDANASFQKFRNWTKNAKEPCKSCRYLSICKGGCHIVAEFLTGDFTSPDPECPTVVAYEKALLHDK
jgi:radical SAM protein with 4Fe4S-binding SPASM domain